MSLRVGTTSWAITSYGGAELCERRLELWVSTMPSGGACT